MEVCVCQEYQSLTIVFNAVKDFEGLENYCSLYNWNFVFLRMMFGQEERMEYINPNNFYFNIFKYFSISHVFVAHSSQISMKFLMQ